MTVIKEEMVDKHINRHDVLPISFLKKSAYTGSKRGLRYKLEKTEVPLDDEAEGAEAEKTESEKTEAETVLKLRCYSWTGPFAFDHTSEEEMTVQDFAFDDNGLAEAVMYLDGLLKELEKT